MTQNDTQRAPKTSPVRSEVDAKQGTGPRVMIWVLLFSILLAVIAGGVLLNADDDLSSGVANGNSQTSQPVN
ncbi:MAG: hypothetical protein HC850_03480 [Rhodomicrobium sp.]|nr:hypothetical protein [Rhodomicrobium sp.]